MEHDQQQLIWEVRDYASLLQALQARIVALDVSAASVEGVAGLTDGYLSKILRRPLRSMRPITMGILLQSLGVKLVMVDDVEQLERVRARLGRRDKRGPHLGAEYRSPHRAPIAAPPEGGNVSRETPIVGRMLERAAARRRRGRPSA
jgi:hypothetical protein